MDPQIGRRSPAWTGGTEILDDAEAEFSRHLNLWSFREDPGAARRSLFSSRRVDGARLVECNFGPSYGRRGPSEIACDRLEEFCLIFVNHGEEQWITGAQCMDIVPGTIATWLTSRPIAFRVRRHLHKFVLTVPRERISGMLGGKDLDGGLTITPAPGMNALLSSCIQGLFSNHAELSDRQFSVMVDQVIVMLGLLDGTHQRPQASRTSLYERAIVHIESQLDDAELTPQKIADFLGISLRYLHSQFAGHGASVSRWILHRRLSRCRLELESGARKSVGEVAYRWGFKSHAHFTRAFRAQFSVSPSEYRAMRDA